MRELLYKCRQTTVERSDMTITTTLGRDECPGCMGTVGSDAKTPPSRRPGAVARTYRSLSDGLFSISTKLYGRNKNVSSDSIFSG